MAVPNYQCKKIPPKNRTKVEFVEQYFFRTIYKCLYLLFGVMQRRTFVFFSAVYQFLILDRKVITFIIFQPYLKHGKKIIHSNSAFFYQMFANCVHVWEKLLRTLKCSSGLVEYSFDNTVESLLFLKNLGFLKKPDFFVKSVMVTILM